LRAQTLIVLLAFGNRNEGIPLKKILKIRVGGFPATKLAILVIKHPQYPEPLYVNESRTVHPASCRCTGQADACNQSGNGGS
jgi:hypothetical protein